MERHLSTYDDSALVVECLKRIEKNGSLVLSHEAIIGALRKDAGHYLLEHTGLPITSSDTVF